MKIDFHTHAKLAKYLPFSKEYTDWLFAEAVFAGLDAICLTEHFNTQGFTEIYQYVNNTYEKENDCYITENGLRIFPGMEVDIAEGGHTLVIGNMESILELNCRLEKNKEKEFFLNAKDWMEIAMEYDVILGAAHPYREGGNIPNLPDFILEQFQFIDYNGKDMITYGASNMERIFHLAEKINCPIVAGSDTHQSFQYGCIYNDFIEKQTKISLLRREMELENFKICISENAEFKVKSAGILKKALKVVDACGGDYISILTKNDQKHTYLGSSLR